jgi:hypothetical protein
MMRVILALYRTGPVLALFLFLTCPSFGQNEEFEDRAVGDDKAYFIDGDSVTFSGNPDQTQLMLLGKWSSIAGAEQTLSLDFKDPQTVIATFKEGSIQSKGTWILSGNQITCNFNGGDANLPTKLSATIKPKGLQIAKYGTLSKNN